MRRVDVTLNGRPYAVACEAGQEARLKQLAAYVDARLREVSGSAVVGSEAQVLALTALVLADQLFDLKAEYDALASRAPQGSAPREDDEMVVAAVDHLAKRIEDIAARLERA